MLNVQTPRRKADIRAFVGMIQFLHKFLPNLADELEILTRLTKQKVRWRWTQIEQVAFDAIRDRIRGIEKLYHPDFSKPFEILCDASQKGIGGALCQKVDGELQPVYFCSKIFNETQQNWHVSEQELYAAVYCIEKWRPLLTHRRFHVHTDHRNLIKLLDRAENFRSGKLYRWCQRIQDLDFDCHYIKGSENKFADYLFCNGLFLEHVPADVQSGKLDNRDIAQTYHLLLCARSIGLSEDGVDAAVRLWSESRSPAADSLPLILPDLDRFPTDALRAIPTAPRTAIPPVPTFANEYSRLRLTERRRADRVTRTLRAQPLSVVHDGIGPVDAQRLREWNRWILKNQPEKEQGNEALLEPPPTSPILDFYDPKSWTKALLKEKQGEDMWTFIIRRYLLTGNKAGLSDFAPYWKHHVVDGRFSLDDEGILRYAQDERSLIVVPAPLRKSLMKVHHPGVVHDGVGRMMASITVNYMWPKMRAECTAYIKGCEACARVKRNSADRRGKGRLKLFPMEVPLAMISVDIVGPMPTGSNGNRYIVSIIDRFTRFCMFVPVKNIKTLDVLQAWESWISLFGRPDCILSDNGPQFVSYMFGDYMKAQGIELRATSTYHPQCNGMVERIHRWLKERLALIAYDAGLDFIRHDDWSPYLKLIAFAYNTTPNRMPTCAPSELVLGFNPTSITRADPGEFCKKTPRKYADWLSRRIAILKNRAVRAQKRYDAIRKRGYDKGDAGQQYEVGETVMYDASGPRTGNVKKLLPDFIGPYEVMRVSHDGQLYRIQSLSEPDIVFDSPRLHLKIYNKSESPDEAPAVILLRTIRNRFLRSGSNSYEADRRSFEDTTELLLL